MRQGGWGRLLIFFLIMNYYTEYIYLRNLNYITSLRFKIQSSKFNIQWQNTAPR